MPLPYRNRHDVGGVVQIDHMEIPVDLLVIKLSLPRDSLHFPRIRLGIPASIRQSNTRTEEPTNPQTPPNIRVPNRSAGASGPGTVASWPDIKAAAMKTGPGFKAIGLVFCRNPRRRNPNAKNPSTNSWASRAHGDGVPFSFGLGVGGRNMFDRFDLSWPK